MDSNNKATELPLLRVCGTVQQNPHMRALLGRDASAASEFGLWLYFFAMFRHGSYGILAVLVVRKGSCIAGVTDYSESYGASH